MPRVSIARSALMAGLFAFALGVLGAVEAMRYPFGTAGQIGPAIFPLGLSILLTLSGIAILAEGALAHAADEPEPVPRDFVTILAIVGGPIAFALSVERIGLVPAIFASVVISGLADRELKLRTTLVLAAILAAGCWLVFVYFLRLPLRPFMW